MRTLLCVVVIAIAVVVFVPAARASVTYCAPEYPTCDEQTKDDPSTGGTGGPSGTTYEEYGADYDACSASGNQSCYSCRYVLRLKGVYCTSSASAGSCYCREEYSYGRIVGCSARGTCDYSYD